MKIEVKESKLHGRGIFATQDINEDEIIEDCPLIICNTADEEHFDKTALKDYYFDWEEGKTIAIALGYGSLYNHSYNPNAKFSENSQNTLIILAIKPIKKGEEITVNYNGHNSDEKVWFDCES
ncbi:MAG: SET domain-containing protein [Candidatus Nanoarchaeia archaeon]|nr:SET domain-containing protein [Candidatus Nanoarchaeia archaeon]